MKAMLNEITRFNSKFNLSIILSTILYILTAVLMLLFIVRVKQSIILLSTIFDDKVIQCTISFTLNVVSFNCVIFPKGNIIKQVYKKNSIIMSDYHIF